MVHGDLGALQTPGAQQGQGVRWIPVVHGDLGILRTSLEDGAPGCPGRAGGRGAPWDAEQQGRRRKALGGRDESRQRPAGRRSSSSGMLQPVLLPPGCQRPDSPRRGAATQGGGTDVTPCPLLPRPQTPGSGQDGLEPPAPRAPCPAPGALALCRSKAGCLQEKGTALGHPHKALTLLNSMLKQRAARVKVLGAGSAPSPCRTPQESDLGLVTGAGGTHHTPGAEVLGSLSQRWLRPSKGSPGLLASSNTQGFFFFKMIAFNSQPKQLFLRDSSRRGEKSEPL